VDQISARGTSFRKGLLAVEPAVLLALAAVSYARFRILSFILLVVAVWGIIKSIRRFRIITDVFQGDAGLHFGNREALDFIPSTKVRGIEPVGGKSQRARLTYEDEKGGIKTIEFWPSNRFGYLFPVEGLKDFLVAEGYRELQ
jgi:hypothetical protein